MHSAIRLPVALTAISCCLALAGVLSLAASASLAAAAPVEPDGEQATSVTQIEQQLVDTNTQNKQLIVDTNTENEQKLVDTNKVVESDGDTRKPRTIRVGVRSDARPFSYQGATGANETILSNYRGYMVEICRRVLRDMVSSGPFMGYSVETMEVDPVSRFDDLESGKLDLLCGPDSITSSRLRRHTVSHPMFLSGMTYGYTDPQSGRFPRSQYCGNIVGVVRGTTAASRGLEMLAAENVLLRFDQALELYLAKSPTRLQAILDVENRIMSENPGRGRSKLNYLIEPEIVKIQNMLKPEIQTDECPGPDGFKDGLPVRLFNNHDEGIDAFCAGHVLYYVGDFDIIRSKIESRSSCPVILERFTQTREIYASFFRTGFSNAGTDPSKTTRCQDCTINAPLLYAVFNHTLLRMMQANINILEYEFTREFGDTQKSQELQQFFNSFKVASDI